MGVASLVTSWQIPIETLFTIVVLSCCVYIFSKMWRLYTLSKYKGLKYFAYTYLFLGITFFIRYIAVGITHVGEDRVGNLLGGAIWLIAFYAASVAGFYLLYSLVWKQYETHRLCTFFRRKHLFLHLFAILVAVVEFVVGYMLGVSFWIAPFFFYAMQFLVIGKAIVICHKKKTAEKQKAQFLHYYFGILIVMFSLYAFFLMVNLTIHTFPTLRLVIWTFVPIAFLIMTYLVRKVISLPKSAS